MVLERKRACLLLERCEGGTLLTLVQGRVNESKARIARERRASGSTGVAASAAGGAGLSVVANLFGAPREPPPPYCLSEPEARAGLRAATEALRYVHDRGYVHRDVKLENLLVATPLDLSTLKLADFGFATTSARPSGAPRVADKGLQGTVEYAAPEILAAYRGQKAKSGASAAEAEAAVRARPSAAFMLHALTPCCALFSLQARPAVDMWSLGVTLFLMLGVRAPPFIPFFFNREGFPLRVPALRDAWHACSSRCARAGVPFVRHEPRKRGGAPRAGPAP